LRLVSSEVTIVKQVKSNRMHLQALKWITDNKVELIEENVVGTKYDPSTTVGIAKLLLANKGDLDSLSAPQRYHYEEFIKPLIESVPCEGVFGEDTCSGNGYIDDESLIGCYIEQYFGQFRS
jgi:hypothetical protein